MDINELDYRILKYFRENGPTTIAAAEKALLDIDAVEIRIKVILRDTVFLEEQFIKQKSAEHTTQIVYTGIFNITPYGRKVLQDYEVAENKRMKDIWLQNAKIPILVSIATNFTVDGIQWLLPQIQQWLASFQP